MSSYDPLLHHRRSIRLKGFDYTQAGLYFITICVQNRLNLFGEIVPEKSAPASEERFQTFGERAPTRGAPTVNTEIIMRLNETGNMIEQPWVVLPQRFPNIRFHEFVVMPNHFHGIIEIVGAPLVGALTHHDPIFAIPENSELGKGQSINTQQPAKGQPQGIATTIGDIIGAFKSSTINDYIKGVKTRNWQPFNGKLWQRNYWEHIIRDEKDYHVISEYIRNNPSSWPIDYLNPSTSAKQKSLSGN